MALMDAKEGSLWLRNHTGSLIGATVLLTVLYLGRSVLIPLALAIMLSFLLAPLVRALERLRLGRTAAVLIVVFSLVASFLGVATMLGAQVLRVAETLPRYEQTIRHKLTALDQTVASRMRLMPGDPSHWLELADVASGAASAPAEPLVRAHSMRRPTSDSGGVTLTAPSLHLTRTALRSAWVPLQGAGIVLLVLVFVLLEHETLRDRFIRIAGVTDVRHTTLALNDAAERLSRFFISQFVVNLVFGMAIWASLTALHFPQALLCGTLAAVMRFVPYIGVGIAALVSTALAFAINPGWSLSVATLSIFLGLDVVVAQLVEPHLYGHATGLSPLAVVVATIFWSALWGPMGLILSTPLTLCLLVAGRHIKALGMLELLLGDARPLTLSQNFYHRALAGDPHEIVAKARVFLRDNSLAAYCDQVLIPALHLSRLDAASGATDESQQARIRRVMVDVIASLSSGSLKLPRRVRRTSVLQGVTAATWLREQREQLTGRWQGPLGVAPRSVVICCGLGGADDDLASELLVRLLRMHSVDARHFYPAEVAAGLPPGADPEGVAMVFLVSAFAGIERENAGALSARVEALLPGARIVRVYCPGVIETDGGSVGDNLTELTVASLEEAVDFSLSSQQHPAHEPPARPPLRLHTLAPRSRAVLRSLTGNEHGAVKRCPSALR